MQQTLLEQPTRTAEPQAAAESDMRPVLAVTARVLLDLDPRMLLENPLNPRGGDRRRLGGGG